MLILTNGQIIIMHFNFSKKSLLLPIVALTMLITVFLIKLTIASPAVPNPGHNYAEVEFPTGVVFTSSGQLGIGTTGPNSKLEIVGGDIRIGDDRNYYFRGGTDTAWSIKWVSATADVLMRGSGAGSRAFKVVDSTNSDQVAFSTEFLDGDTYIRGNVGIGTANPNALLTLDINQPTQTKTYIQLDNTAAGYNDWAIRQTTFNDLSIYNYATASDALTIQNSGNVGIGTTAPSGKLTIIGSNTPSPTLSLRQYNDATDGFDFDLETDVVGRLDLYRVVDGARNQVLSVLRGSGNVGIGTTNPTARLEVNNEIKTINVNTNYIYNSDGTSVVVSGDTLSVDTGLRLFPSAAPASLNGMVYYDSTLNKFRCYENGAWKDCIGAGGASGWTDDGTTVRLTTSTDNVGIGTTNPSAKLDVSGSIEYTSKPWLRFTRTSVSSSSSDAIKDSQCSSEFGSAYVAANGRDVAALRGGISNPSVYFNVAGNSDSWFVWSSSYGYIFMTIATGDTYSMACVHKYAPLRFTRVSVSNSALDSTKDTQCSTEFGSNYQAAVLNDVGALWGTTALGLGFVVAGDTTRLWSVSGGTNAALLFTFICCGTASDSLACVHK